MALGQIHIGKNGPENCKADSSKPRSRGCPLGTTGHFDSMDEAMDSYASMNSVDSGELKILVADGATAKDAVGLIRAGYGSDYFAAQRRELEEAPELTVEEHGANYLEAKNLVSLELSDASPEVRVEGTRSGKGTPGLVIRKSSEDTASNFSYVVVEVDGDLHYQDLSAGEVRDEFIAVGGKLSAAIERDDNPGLRAELKRMLDSYDQMETREPEVADHALASQN